MDEPGGTPGTQKDRLSAVLVGPTVGGQLTARWSVAQTGHGVQSYLL